MEAGSRSVKGSPVQFEAIFGFELKIDAAESEKVGPYIVGTLGVHKDMQVREAEYKKKRNEILDKINSVPSKEKKDKSVWQEDDPVMEAQFPLAFAKSLFYYKRTTFSDKPTLYSRPETEDEIDQDKRMKWKVEANYKRQLDYFKDVARYSPIRNLRECREQNCMYNRITKPIVRHMFEQAIVDEAKNIIKTSKSNQTDFVYTSYLCDALLQDLVAITKLSEKIGARSLRVNLIDTRYKQWLAKSRDAQIVQSKHNQKQSSNVIHVKPSVKLEEQFFALERDKLPPLLEKQDDKEEELDKAAQLLVINDTLYQFTEWMHNYASYRVSSLRVILYDDPNSYLEECKINASAKSDILVSSICNCNGSLKSPHDVTVLAEGLKSNGSMINLVIGEIKLPEADTSIEKGEIDTTGKLAIYGANANLRKYYDFEKRTWNNFVQHKNTSPPSKKIRSPQQHRAQPPAFQPPDWAAPLTTQKGVYVLQVIKDSKQVDSIPFTQNGKLYFLLGRSADLCDIELANPLISRQHAAIVFNKEEEPYIIDLNSAHGTFLDSTKLDPYTPMPLQEGSILKFGTSSRKYILLRKPSTDLLRSETKEEASLDSEDFEAREQAEDYDNDVQSPEDSSLDVSSNETSKKRDPMSISSLLAGEQEEGSSPTSEEFDTSFFVTKKPRSQ